MLGELSSSLTELDEDVRVRLAGLLEKRNRYLTEAIKLNELRIRVLMNPSELTESQANAFNSTVVAPLRDAMSDDMQFLTEKAINFDGIQAMLPMVVAGLLQSVNLTLLFTMMGADPDMIERSIGDVSKFIKSGE